MLLRGIFCGFQARQWVLTGQRSQAGARGLQIKAPSSINAELNVPGSGPATNLSASSQSTLLPGSRSIGISRPVRRAKTRVTLASRMGAGKLNAKLATAPAVYRPIPGNCRRDLTSQGNLPPQCSTPQRAD